MGFQMLGVAVGWQLYELTGSALDLGLVGLVRLIVVVCEIVKAAAAAALALGSMGGWQSRTSIFALVALLGAAQAFENPAMTPTLFRSVIVFGVATVVFGVSTNFVLSLVALTVLGAADVVSMVIRMSLAQIRSRGWWPPSSVRYPPW